MSDFKGTLEHFQVQKFKKTEGFESKLDKLTQKAEKAKGGKNDIEVKSVRNGMNFKSLGKKEPPVTSLEYDKIGNIRKVSASNVVGFTYPGPDKKTPLTLNAMKFKDKIDYDYFIQKMESKARSQSPETPKSGMNSEHAEVTSANSHSNGKRNPRHSDSPSQKKHQSRPTSYNSFSSDSQKNARIQPPGVLTYVSTENIFPEHRSHRRDSLSDYSTPSPLEISYIATTSRIRDSTSARGIGRSSKPRKSRGRDKEVKVTRVYRATRSMSRGNSYSSSSEGSYSSSSRSDSPYDNSRLYYSSGSSSSRSSRSSSRSSSSGSSSDSSGLQLYGRSFVISRCTRDRNNRVRCRPLGDVRVTRQPPTFY